LDKNNNLTVGKLEQFVAKHRQYIRTMGKKIHEGNISRNVVSS